MNIALYTHWGQPRNTVMYMRSLVNVLKNDHTIFIVNKSNTEIRPEFRTENVTILNNDDNVIKTLTENNIDMCIFNCYNSYKHEGNLVKECKDKDIKTVGYIPYDNIDKINIKDYDCMLSPSRDHKIKLLVKGYKSIYMPTVCNKQELDKVGKKDKQNDTYVYLFVKGVDVFNSLDSDFIENNWIDIKQPNEELFIIDKNSYVMERNNFIKYLKSADAVILPYTKREDVCSLAIECMGCGTPVISYDVSGVKEVVKNNKTGYLINIEHLSTEEKIHEYKKVLARVRVPIIKDVLDKTVTKLGNELSTSNDKLNKIFNDKLHEVI